MIDCMPLFGYDEAAEKQQEYSRVRKFPIAEEVEYGMNLKSAGKALMSIHDDFFRLDKQEKLARIDLEFSTPSEIFSPTVQAGVPMMSEEFLAQLFNTFDLIPDRYKLDISVSFSDLEGYTEERLEEIFRKNLMLTLRILARKTRRRNRLVLALCMIGLVFILLTTWLARLWSDEGTGKDIVFFILDIVATVPFWGAMDIWLVEGSERRKTAANIRKRFNSISFRLKTADFHGVLPVTEWNGRECE